MSDSQTALFGSSTHSNWVRLRTLILLRWVAIAGQIGAISFAIYYYGLQLELGFVFAAIGASVVANLVSISVFPESRRLSQSEAAWVLLFDIAQLGVLLFLTGGLHNPFALLIVAPVTISATALPLRSTVMLGLVAAAVITFLTWFHIPLRTDQGSVLRMPDIFVFGFWVAILIGILFLGIYARRVTSEIHSMSQALLATQMALSREQKLTDLGGVVAAAAHELGTPLATIKLASAELMEELEDMPELHEDAALIREQADRCRNILHSMGRAGKNDLHLKSAPLSAVVQEAAEPHTDRGKAVHFDFEQESGKQNQPVIYRQPEIIHGLRNLIQNAVDFSAANVWIEARWTSETILLRVVDDGPGYPTELIGRIGDPFVRQRSLRADQKARPEYKGMGLGLFIAKTLLERSGAELAFANGSDPFSIKKRDQEKLGAIVEVSWSRRIPTLEYKSGADPLGENQIIQA